MPDKPNDTSAEAWATQRAIWRKMGPEARVAVAIELSEAVREIQIDGLMARNPGWSRADAVRELVTQLYGVELPRPS